METIFYYQNHTARSHYLGSMLCCFIVSTLLSITTCHAQLNGTYTIGGANGTYANFNEAIMDLETQGVSGPVIFNVKPGTYQEQVIISHIPGNSCSNTITFEGTGASPAEVVLQAQEGLDFTLEVQGADGIKLRNLSITKRINTAPGTNCFSLENSIIAGDVYAFSSAAERSNQHQYSNNIFQNGVIVKKNEAPWNPEAPIFDQGLVIEGNEFRGVGSISIEGQRGFTISNNRIPYLPQQGGGIKVTNSWYGEEISGNSISTDVRDYKGIGMVLSSSAAARITKNIIRMTDGGFTMDISLGKSLGDEILIANNYVSVSGHDARGHNYFPITNLVGINMTNNYENKVKIYHNTIWISGYSEYVPNYALSVKGTYKSFHIINNLIANSANGSIIVSDGSAVASLHHNSLYDGSSGINPGGLRNPNEALIGAGTYLAEVPTDFFGQTRNNPPTIGAVERAVSRTPLSGHYTIGGESPDFLNFTEAVDAMKQHGISDSITFKVRAGEYNEQLTYKGVYGENAVVLFESESGDSTDVVLHYPFDKAIALEGVKNFTFRHMTVGSGVRMARSSNILFDGNIIAEGVNAYEVTFNEYHNNVFKEKGIDKSGEGFVEQAGHVFFNTDNHLVIKGNTFDVQNKAISLFAQKEVRINNNKIIIRNENKETEAIGIDINSLLDIEEIKNNTLISDHTNTTGIRLTGHLRGELPQELTNNSIFLRDGGTGIKIDYYASSFSNSLIANNLISINATNSSTGIAINSLQRAINFYFNSVYLYGEDASSRVVYFGEEIQGDVHFRNNILANQTGGYIFFGEDFEYTPNKIASSNYNDLYTNGEVLAQWQSGAISNLSAWHTATGFDMHSLSVDPQFPSAENLTPGNQILDNAGIALADVTTDFYDNLRKTPPTIGAIELGVDNQPPVAYAGVDRTVILPQNSIILSGQATDPDGVLRAFLWEKVSGPEVTMQQQNTANLKLSDLVLGQYVFRFTATDNKGASASDEMTLTVRHPNQPPVADAGEDKLLYLPDNSIILSGQASDPDGDIVAYQWEQVYGPSASMAQENTANLMLSNLVEGVYIFRFSATDNIGATASDKVRLVVKAPDTNLSPVVDAGEDRTVTLPVDRLVISGTGFDPDGSFQAFQWEKVSGPAVSMQQQNTANLVLTDLQAGEYIFRFTGTDNMGASASDEMMLTVIGSEASTILASTTKVTAYPNTFRDYINIKVESETAAQYQLEIYDALGRTYYQSSFVAEPLKATEHQLDLSGEVIQEGVYFIRIKGDNYQEVIRVMKAY